jgi:hypothetical protein
MGLPDPYSFVVGPEVLRKLEFIQRVVLEQG